MADFSINVGANVDGAVKSVSRLKNEFATLPNDIDADAIAFREFGDAAEGSIQEARLRVKSMKEELASLSSTRLNSSWGKDLAADLKVAQAELKNLEREANLASSKSGNRQTVRAGIELSNLAVGQGSSVQNLNSLVHTFGRLTVETGSAKAAFSALGASLFGPTGILLALPLIIEGVTKLIEHFTALSERQKQAKKDAEDLKKATDGVFGTVAKEATQVLTLVDVLKSENETRGRKAEALKELQKLAPDNFNNLKLEGDAVKGLDAAYQSYLANLKNVITVKVLQARLEQLIEQQLKKQGTTAIGIERIGTLEGEREELERLNAEYKKTNDPGTLGRINFLTAILKTQADGVDDLQKKIDSVNEQLKAFTQGVELHKETTKKDVDELKKQLEALEKLAQSVKEIHQLTDIKEKIIDLKVRILLRDAAKDHLSKTDIESGLQGYKDELQKIFTDEAIALEAIPKVKFSQTRLATIPKEVESEMAKSLKKITPKTSFEIDLEFFGWDEAKKREALRNFDSAITKFYQQELPKKIQELSSNLQIGGFEILGNALGDAFTKGFGEALKEGAKALLILMGDTLQQLGKFIIQKEIEILALKKVLQQFAISNPVLAITAGVGLIALGAALKNSFQGQKFASGGIVTGPTVGMVGEAGSEAIIPLSRLQNLIGGTSTGNSNITIGLGIKGRELIPFIQRETALFNRIH